MHGGSPHRTRNRAAAALAATAAALVLVQCGERGSTRQGAESTATPLRVEAHLPEGETPARFSVDVVFDRPMARLGDAAPSADRGRKLLALEPQPAGTYAWIGTRTLSFTATGGLPAATAFHARVPKGVAALDGTRLEADVAWEFSTERPALVASAPAANERNARPGDPIVLLFNIPVDPQAVAHAATLEGVERFDAARPDSALLRDLDARFWGAAPERLVVLRPSPKLAPDHDYELRLGENLRAQVGTLGPAEPLRIPFHTYGPPGLQSVNTEGAGVVRLAFRTPVDPDSARAWLRFDPPVEIASAWGNGSMLYLTGDFGFEKTYTVTARAGLPDLFGQRLPADVSMTVTTSKRDPTLQLLPSDAVLLPSTPRTVALVSVGMGAVRVRARRIGAVEEMRLRSQPLSPGERWSLDRKFPAAQEAGKLVQETVDVKSVLPASGLGAVVVEARSQVPPTDGNTEAQEWQVRSLLRWSDIGLSLKMAPENGLAWVTRLATAKPLTGATLRILDDNAKVLWRGKSDAQGMAHLPGMRQLGREAWQLSLVAASGADTAMSSLQPDWRLEPWRFDIPGAYGTPVADQRAYLYTDRDLYRPGETVRLAGLVRRFTSGGLGAAGIDSVQILARDPMGREFVRRGVAVDKAGGFALDLATPSGATLGRYWIEANVRRKSKGQGKTARPGERDQETIGSLGVELAAFRAAAFRAEVRPRPAQLFPGGTLTERVRGAYYFGAPLAGAPFSWSAVRERVDFRPRGFDDYAFSDPDQEASQGALLASGNGALSDSGLATLQVELPPELPVATQAINFEATIRDPSGDAVSGRATVLYHPTKVYAGVAVEPSFVDAGQAITARLVAVRADTAMAVAGTPLVVEFVRRDWREVRKLLVGGRVGFETTSIDSTFESREVVSAKDPVEVRFTPSSPGSYRVRVRARDGARTSPAAVASFWAAGARDGAWRAADAIRLEMKVDRKLYRAGDTARILVTTPLQAQRALLTIEREGLLESRLVTLDRGSQVIEIPVKPEYLPNVYVGLAVAEPALTEKQAPSLPEPARLPRYVVGYVALHIDVESRRLGVEVKADHDEYRPGDRASLAVQVRDADGAGRASRVGIAVVDESVLALLGTAVPDPFAFFYQERALATSNADTRLRLSAGSRLEAAKFKGEAGGDGAEKLAARSLFTTTAYWNPAVETDAEGRARVEFTLPDNLTSFRVVALAASDIERFGVGRTSFRVAKPLTIDPALPRFALQGDTLEVAAVVTNRTAAPLRGSVALATDLEPLATTTQTVDLPANASVRVGFRTRATRAGDARVRLEARFPGATDAVETRLPVSEPRVARGAATAAHTNATAVEQLAVPAAALPGSAWLDVGLAASALGGARPAYDYVVQYPYGCIEQLSSRLLVLVSARELFAPTGADSQAAVASIAATIHDLELAAPSWGPFPFWRGGSEAGMWLTAYAAYALGHAQKAGFAVDANVLANAQGTVARAWRQGREATPENAAGDSALAAARAWWLQQPAGLGLLALSETLKPERDTMLEPADVDLLVDHAADLAEDERLLLALALDNWSMRPEFVTKTLDRALQHVEVTAAGAALPATGTSCWPMPFRTTARATSLTLWLASRARAQDAMTPRLATGLLGMRAGGHWHTTQDDALALLALAAYRDRVERASGAVEASVHVDANPAPLIALTAPGGSLARSDTTVTLGPATTPGGAGAPGGPATAGREARLEFATRGLVHYNAAVRWEEDARTQPAEESGFTVVRRLQRFEGAGPVRLGDLVVVTLTLVVPRESWYLGLVDPLPAGLEIVQSAFQVESRAVSREVERWPLQHTALPVSHVESRDRELRVFADFVAAGVYEHRYVARVRAVGGFAHLPARLEAMYAPELHASTPATRWRSQPQVPRKPAKGPGVKR